MLRVKTSPSLSMRSVETYRSGCSGCFRAKAGLGEGSMTPAPTLRKPFSLHLTSVTLLFVATSPLGR
jgi:hypothetical protein